MDSNKNLELARKAYPYNENLRVAYMLGLEKGYDQAMKDVFEWIEKNIPCGEMSSEDVLGFIIECKEYFKGEN